MDEDKWAHIPIPSYDEATSSRPTSSQNFRGAQEVSDDAERQGLLEQNVGGAYQHPTVESARSSVDSDLRLPEVTGDGDDDRRRIEELDYLDPSAEASQRERGLYHRARLRTQFSKHLANISATFSSIRLPRFRSLYTPVATADSTTEEAQPPERHWLRSWLRAPGFASIPDQYKMSAPTFARLCGLFIIGFMVYILFALDMFPGNRRRMGTQFDPEAVRQFVQEGVNSESLGSYLHHITSYDHVAGTEGDLYLAKWMQERWVEEGGFDEVKLADYYVYLNYPTLDGRSVQLVSPESKKWTAKLEENQIDDMKQETFAWHGHSKSGDAKGHLIYANGGSREDFKWLQDEGIETKGAIALVRYYGTQGDRALKVKAAGEAGCFGILIYSDPIDDGAGKGAVWPDGPWRPDDSLQRGAVSYMSWLVGDPLTPGWASTKDAKRISKESSPALPGIPSLPLAWRDAKVLLEALQGQGKEVPESWRGGGPDDRGLKWFSGSKKGKDAPVVELRNENDENDKQQIWNLHGVIEGIEQPEKKVIIGNHRDSWCFGAVDPGSGSAVMMEIIALFLALRKLGWRPLRTIEFVSWDAEEYNLVGSTEYVEDNMNYLRENGVAYLNVDVGVSGPNFRAAGSPAWNKALNHVLKRVSDPESNSTLHQIWEQKDGKLEGLGAGSDYVAFQDMAGTSSIDFGFEGPQYGFPYHSCYETYDWMSKFGDPDFHYHRTLAQVWALLILEIADRPIIPFDLHDYAKAVHQYIERLQQDFDSLSNNKNKINFKPLRDAADNLSENINTFHTFEDIWTSNVLGSGGLESANFAIKRLEFNNRLSHFETDLLDIPTGESMRKGDKESDHGIPGRQQFKHVIFGPQAWSGYDEAYFPAIRDAVEAGEWKRAQEWVEKTAQILRRAGEKLVV